MGDYIYPAGTDRRPHAPLTIAGEALSWDAAGNMTAGRGRQITWDGINRPSQITVGTGGAAQTVDFAYGPDGSRWRKTSPRPPQCRGDGAAACCR